MILLTSSSNKQKLITKPCLVTSNPTKLGNEINKSVNKADEMKQYPTLDPKRIAAIRKRYGIPEGVK